jgi:hypothetical protein
MLEPLRFLGFAFANADLLLEIDREGKILFAAGATQGLTDGADATLTGKSAADLFSEDAGARLKRELRALKVGGRTGPLHLRLAGGAESIVALCQLPQNGDRISFTLSKSGARKSLTCETTDTQTGLPEKDSFIAQAFDLAESGDSLSLVSVRGLSGHCSKLPAAEADRLLRYVGDSLKGWGAKLCGRLGDNMFGGVMARGSQPLGDSVRKALEEQGVKLPVEETAVAMWAEGLSGEQRILALRYVVENFESVRRDPNTQDLSAAFDKMLAQTQMRALELTKTVADGAFELAFMPIVHVRNEAFAHYECLARFNNQNTGETIQFAEALGISDTFDFLVAARVLSLAENDKTGRPWRSTCRGARCNRRPPSE